jgi:hypothetical protein
MTRGKFDLKIGISMYSQRQKGDEVEFLVTLDRDVGTHSGLLQPFPCAYERLQGFSQGCEGSRRTRGDSISLPVHALPFCYFQIGRRRVVTAGPASLRCTPLFYGDLFAHHNHKIT